MWITGFQTRRIPKTCPLENIIMNTRVFLQVLNYKTVYSQVYVKKQLDTSSYEL